jgi:phosphoglycolate phosphatase-like HAD superfamily hydrolase
MAHDPDLIVFDLDGTLVNSLPDVAAAGNSALRRL